MSSRFCFRVSFVTCVGPTFDIVFSSFVITCARTILRGNVIASKIGNRQTHYVFEGFASQDGIKIHFFFIKNSYGWLKKQGFGLGIVFYQKTSKMTFLLRTETFKSPFDAHGRFVWS